MSKAQDWVERFSAYERRVEEAREELFGDLSHSQPTFAKRRLGNDLVAATIEVTQEDMGLDFYPTLSLKSITLNQDEALKLADWIYEWLHEPQS